MEKLEIRTMKGTFEVSSREEFDRAQGYDQIIGIRTWDGTKWKKVRLVRSLYQ